MIDTKYLHGTVIKGEQWGRLIGFPTANLSHEFFKDHPVADGVYAGWTWVGRERFASAAVVGVPLVIRPEVKKNETHLIGVSKNLYGQTITVELVKRLRGITKFRGVPLLMKQVRHDIRQARVALRTNERARQEKRQALLHAAAIAGPILKQALAGVRRQLRPGVTEQAIARFILGFFRRHGYRTSFPTSGTPIIVAFGPAAATPHHRPGTRRLRTGDLVKIDCGIKVQGWCTDLTRMFVIGQPTTKQAKLYRLVLQAQQAALKGARPGMTGQEIDALARNIIKRAGFGKQFIHGTGHGLGQYIHEPPFLSPRTVISRVAIGDVITIEPGIYLPGWGGVRIEDMAVMTKDGLRLLTASIPNSLLSAVI